MINIPYRLVSRWGRLKARLYRWRLPYLLRHPVPTPGGLDAVVYCFSGARDLALQVASLRSLLRHAGSPQAITVVSDGTHSPAECALLLQVHASVQVVPYRSFIRRDLSRKVEHYAQASAMGMKLAFLLSVPVNHPTIYSDSDILYFPAARELADRVRCSEAHPEYLLDCWPSLDERLLASPQEKLNPVNGGFLILRRPMDWAEALDRFERMPGTPAFFSEQTLVHLALKRNGAEPLPPERYVLQNDDQWCYADKYARQPIVLRHYISSIRHKMWLQVKG